MQRETFSHLFSLQAFSLLPLLSHSWSFNCEGRKKRSKDRLRRCVINILPEAWILPCYTCRTFQHHSQPVEPDMWDRARLSECLSVWVWFWMFIRGIFEINQFILYNKAWLIDHFFETTPITLFLLFSPGGVK